MTGREDHERLGAFYLGRAHDVASKTTGAEPIFYDAKDLTTHAVIVGMTGSGKTGLGVVLLEEAAIDGIPAIAIDPKGDLGSLMLAFPELAAASFEPWVDPAEAERAGVSVAEHADGVARRFGAGLAQWGQGGERVRRFADAAEVAIYTPGSDAGLPLTVLRSFAPPPESVRADSGALGEQAQAAAAGLLALVGVGGDPLQDREAILVASLLQHAWQAGRGLELPELIRQIQAPPFERLGVLELESFFPAAERAALALRLNGVLASPGFTGWLRGEPLDIARLLHTAGGKPRISVLSIAHLSDPERMFFVTILLNEIVAWMRAQTGTASLRALLYMDEIHGFFPPSAEPPSKRPMLTLLKQARAFGLGCVLATQNPADLDYKALSNAGTWLIGRLQTERDKLRLLDGLEGAAGGMQRAALERLLGSLGQRVFLLHDVHEDRPVTFQTRCSLCYLRGPLTRVQIAALMAGRKAAAAPPPAAPAAAAPGSAAGAPRPVLPEGVVERFAPPGAELAEPWIYRPELAAELELHYVRAAAKVDLWRTFAVRAALALDGTVDWGRAELVPAEPGTAGGAELAAEPVPGARFAPLPAAAERASSYATWAKALALHAYRERPLRLQRCPRYALVSAPGESESAFRLRLAQEAREERDRLVEQLRRQYAPKLARLEERLRKAGQRLERETEQYEHSRQGSWISLGTTLVGSLLGRKVLSSTGARGVGASLRAAGRASAQKRDIGRADADRVALAESLKELEAEFQAALAGIEGSPRPDELELEELRVAPRKGDIAVGRLQLVWRPGA